MRAAQLLDALDGLVLGLIGLIFGVHHTSAIFGAEVSTMNLSGGLRGNCGEGILDSFMVGFARFAHVSF